MFELSEGWALEIERGPDWLFVRLRCPDDGDAPPPALADAVWRLLDQHLAHRIVLECDELTLLASFLIGQLLLLHKRVTQRGGVMRLAGLSEAAQQALATCRLETRFPHYPDRACAIRGERPRQPR